MNEDGIGCLPVIWVISLAIFPPAIPAYNVLFSINTSAFCKDQKLPMFSIRTTYQSIVVSFTVHAGSSQSTITRVFSNSILNLNGTSRKGDPEQKLNGSSLFFVYDRY